MPDVSVVISTYNRVAMLREAIACALGQEGADLELIVVDNGSSDGTSAHLATYDDPRLRVIRNERSLGPTGGRNTGLAAARGEWVAFLDDDDLWAPDKLQRQLDEACRTGAGWVYAGCVYIDRARRILGGQPPLGVDDVVRLLPQLYVIPAGLSGMCFRRDLLDGDGLLDDALRWQTDWDLSLRLLRTGPPAAVMSPLVAYRQHAGQVSQGAARYEPELEHMERKFADLRTRETTFDRGVQHRFIGSEALRGGQRRMALRSYLAGARTGDLGSLLRVLGVALPRAVHPHLRRSLLSDAQWIRQAEGWLDRLPGPHRRVLFVQRTLRQYRVAFFERLRETLAHHGVELAVVHASSALGGARRDAGELSWAPDVGARELAIGDRELVWLPIWGDVRDADLVVVEQASRVLLNFVLGARRVLRLAPAFALWGHGAHMDPTTASPLGERAKRWISRRADWWFAYTDGAARIVSDLGYPRDRITVFQNAIDTTAIATAADAIRPEDVARVRSELGVVGTDVCLFLGNFSVDKRLPMLIEAADRIRAAVPGFELVLVGSGDQEAAVARWAEDRPWLHPVGLRFGADLAAIGAICRLLLVPGWAGLSVVDSFALGVPMVISAGCPHPPETEYLEDGVNGVVSEDDADPARYADRVIAVLQDPAELERLRAGARRSRGVYTLESMVERVTDGILRALAVTGRPAPIADRDGGDRRQQRSA